MSWNYKHMKSRNYLSTNKLIDKTKNGENVPSLGVVGVVLVQCNLVATNINKNEVLYTFTPNKSYFLNFYPSNLVFLKTYIT